MKFVKVILLKLHTTVKWFGLSRLIGSVVSLLFVALAGWWLLRIPPPPPEASLTFAGTTVAARAVADSTPISVSSMSITVHVAGAVNNPGVYKLRSGARFNDGVIAAGGATDQADLNSVNLAMLLNDGEQIYILKRNEKPHTITAQRSPSSATGGSASSGNPKVAIININTASLAELEQLPGVGPSTAKAIIDYREKNGAFVTVQDLINVRGIGPAKLDEILPQARVS
ncbi:MAG: helix-hairpin-helix domain-containing protein [Acidimicrobiaceae bacterium]|nr:helix-hairpin-helix domain-containing protein [Acidimicrobiaceae bacterium]